MSVLYLRSVKEEVKWSGLAQAQSQERLVTLHREGIQNLNPQLATVLQATTQLTPFQNEAPLTNTHTGEAHPLQIWNLQLKLDRFASPILRDLITHHTTYNTAKGELTLMEDALRAAEGKKDTEIMVMWSERFQQERARSEEGGEADIECRHALYFECLGSFGFAWTLAVLGFEENKNSTAMSGLALDFRTEYTVTIPLL